MRESERSRPYHSPRRQEQARLTREKIIDAARRLFGSRGYTATTLPAIAREAGVSAPTITAVFGPKAAILEALINLVLGPDAASEPAQERPWWREMLAEPDPAAQLQMVAAGARRVHERGADVYTIVRGAATADPEFAATMQRRHARLLEDMQTVAEALAAKSALAPGMSVARTADLLWALCGPEVYRSLVIERGWPGDAFQGWLTSTLIHSLLREARYDTEDGGPPSTTSIVPLAAPGEP